MNLDAVKRRVGVNIAVARRARGISQLQLCALMGQRADQQGYISKIERGYVNIELATLVAIANALKVDVERLFAPVASFGDLEPF